MENNTLEVEVNGVMYRKVIREKPKLSSMSRKMLMMGAMYGMPLDPFTRKEFTDAELIYLAKEYELVEQKKSDKSKDNRDKISRQFNYAFVKINLVD